MKKKLICLPLLGLAGCMSPSPEAAAPSTSTETPPRFARPSSESLQNRPPRRAVTRVDAPLRSIRSAPLPTRRRHDRTLYRALDTNSQQCNAIILKTIDEARLRLRGRTLIPDPAARSSRDTQYLSAERLDENTVNQHVESLRRIAGLAGFTIEQRLFGTAESTLDRRRLEAETRWHTPMADLNTYVVLRSERCDAALTRNALQQLNEHRLVEVAYAAPRTSVPQSARCTDLPPVTPSSLINQGQQTHLLPAPAGQGVTDVWSIPGARGDQRRIADVEPGWRWDHEDLPAIQGICGSFIHGDEEAKEHGTATMGVVVGCNNGYGITGIASNATAMIASPLFCNGTIWSVATAINAAVENTLPEDVILIEQQGKLPFWHPEGACSLPMCTGPGSPFWDFWVPVEQWPGEFDAIRDATYGAGRIVVEAAGNAGFNLDTPGFAENIRTAAVDGSELDSGAIMVSGTRSGFTAGIGRFQQPGLNYGSRVDVSGFGENVFTAGYGDIQANGPDVNQFYTPLFNGTSSASAIVAGLVTSFSGMSNSYAPLAANPFTVRRIFRRTGSVSLAPPPPPAAQTPIPAPLAQLSGAARVVNTETLTSVNGSATNQFARVPTLLAHGDQTLEIYGVSTAGQLQLNQRRFGAWSGWTEIALGLPTSPPTEPAVVSTASGQSEVYFVWLDSKIWAVSRSSYGSAFSTPTQVLPTLGTVHHHPRAVSVDTGYVDLFVPGADDRLRHYWHGPSGIYQLSTGFLPNDSQIDSSVAVVSLSNGSLHLFARNSSNQLLHARADASWNWTGWDVLPMASHSEVRASSINSHSIVLASTDSVGPVFAIYDDAASSTSVQTGLVGSASSVLGFPAHGRALAFGMPRFPFSGSGSYVIADDGLLFLGNALADVWSLLPDLQISSVRLRDDFGAAVLFNTSTEQVGFRFVDPFYPAL